MAYKVYVCGPGEVGPQCGYVSYLASMEYGPKRVPMHTHLKADGNWLETAWGAADKCKYPRRPVMSSDPKGPVRRVPGTVAFTDGFLSMQNVWVVIRRGPDRFKVFLSREEARAVMKSGDELWSRHMYESANGSINNWSNFVREGP